LLVVGVIAVVALWRAAQYVPDWYRQAVESSPTPDHRRASDEMERRVADLVSGLKSTGRWQIVFTEEQINSWLAVGLREKHPDALPRGFFDPRVRIEPDGVTLACRTDRGGVSAIVSLKVDVFLASPNVVAVRIRKVRAGRLPWPLEEVLQGLTRAAGEMDVPLRWTTTEGDPVGLFTLRPAGGKKVQVEVIQLDQGRVYVAGTTK